VPEPPAKQAPVPGEAIPGTGDDWFDRALSGLDEAPYQRPGKVAEDDVSHAAGDEGELTRSEIETYRPTLKEPLPAAPAPAEPAVIGRYTSGTTTYIMFADGSIEAETPTGILRFASLAELKVYVEGGQ
jgi:hypothetical protein